MEEAKIVEQETNEESDDASLSPPSGEPMPEDMDDHADVDDELVKSLEKEVSANPYNYDRHVALIDALRKYGELEKLREARQRFASIYPLSPELWLQWIRDERRIDTPWEELRSLFEKAVQDYLSVKVWLEYVQVACSHLGPAEMRGLCERALSHVGLHIADGRLLWDAYRVLESALAEAAAADKSSGSTDRLLQIFKRQLSIPLVGAGETKEEFLETFGEEKFDATLTRAYNAATEELRELSVHEQELQSSRYALDVYLRYLDYEEGHRDSLAASDGSKEKEKNKEKRVPNVARLQCLYERAITDYCLDVSLWLRYVNWLDKRFTSSASITEVVLPIYERAVRNCSWTPVLWSKYALAWERSGVPDWCEKADGVMVRATGEGSTSAVDGSELWLMWAYQKRRAADAGLCSYDTVAQVFENGANSLKEKFGDRSWDSAAAYRRSWASYLAQQSKKSSDGISSIQKLTKARELWRDILGSDGNGRLASVWLEYYQLERRFGDLKEVRKALYNALNSVTDFPDYVASTLKQLELEEGSLRDLDEAEERIRRQTARLEERKLQQHALTTPKLQQHGGYRKDTAGHRQAKNDKNTNESFGKRKILESTPSSSPAKKARMEREPVKTVKPEPPPTPEKRELKKPSDLSDAERRRRTVFVSNLDFHLSEDQLKGVFDGLNIGKVTEVRLMRLNSGRSKGFGYVEFESPESVAKALANDRYSIDGRPMYISEYKERGSNAASNKMEKAAGIGERSAAAEKYHFGAGLEKNKLFVRNIPKHAGETDLRTIFEPYGSLKSIRLVTFPSGQSKGLAFVEYVDEESAAKGLAGTNGQVLFGKQLSVAISNPPPRRTGPSFASSTFQPKPPQQWKANDGHPNKDEQLMPPPKTLLPRVLGARGGSKPRVNL